MLRIFIGYDDRQKVTYNVAQQSLIDTCSKPISITPLVLPTLPITRRGLTPFTYSRFLVPHLCGFDGLALFMDADMLARGDVAELFELAESQRGRHAVWVAKNKLRFEWASLILFDCAHADNRALTPEFVQTADKLHVIGWTDAIGDLPLEWNHLVGYDEPNPDAKLIHYTQGIPAFPETQGTEHSGPWMDTARALMSTQPWEVLMGQSVHAKPVYERLSKQRKEHLCN